MSRGVGTSTALVFERSAGLPALAWCARFVAGSARVVVRCGEGVESGESAEAGGGWFCEGAWDGDFTRGGFERAGCFNGTGGVVRGAAVVLAGATHMLDRLHALRRGDVMWLSSSLAFAFEAADDGPAPDYAHYHRDLLAIRRDGVTRPERAWIPTRRGGRMHVWAGLNVVVARDLRVSFEDKAPIATAHVTTFAAYVALLEGTMRRVLANAADAARVRRYRPMAMLSRGYDSLAVAVLARRVGVGEGIAMRGAGAAGADDDSGRAIGEQLGLRVVELERDAWRSLPGSPEAELSLVDRGHSAPWATLAPTLAGTVALSGFHGDVVWSLARERFATRFRAPWARFMSGASLSEARLRAGWVAFPLPYLAAGAPAFIEAIARAPEMRPYTIGGDYDRPIPRRIIEEAGIARGTFATAKASGAVMGAFQPLDGSRASHVAVRALAAAARPHAWTDALERVMRRLYREERRMIEVVAGLARRVGREVVLSPRVPERYRVAPEVADWSFHWAVAVVRERYSASRDH